MNNLAQVKFVEPVLKEEVSNYGLLTAWRTFTAWQTKPITRVVEKPKKEEAPSNLSIVVVMCCLKTFGTLLAKTAPGAGWNSINWRDCNVNWKEPVEAYHYKEKPRLCSNKLGYMKAFVEYGLQHEEFGEEFTKWIKSLQA